MTSTDFLQKKKCRDLSQFGAPDHGLNTIQMAEKHACVPSVQGTKKVVV